MLIVGGFWFVGDVMMNVLACFSVVVTLVIVLGLVCSGVCVHLLFICALDLVGLQLSCDFDVWGYVWVFCL